MRLKRAIHTILFFGLISFTFAFTPTSNSPAFDEDAIISRIKSMPYNAVKPRYTSVVKSYLKTYTVWGRSKAERILGDRVLYFPLFEEYLDKYGLPSDLKYLSIVESALKPVATSRVGAGGLWQFMPPTAKEVGLKINKYVDERRDPEKSTDAAMRYLKRQYRHFGSWELALAAYNGGSGRVSRAIKRGRSKNFWKIKKYLPRETRNYVPAFIAACYLGKMYEAHQLTPKYPDLDLQFTASIKIYDYLAFSKIAKLTGLPIETVAYLNPEFQRGFIPSDVLGRKLILPKRVIPAIELYLKEKSSTGSTLTAAIPGIDQAIMPRHEFYVTENYRATGGETLTDLADKFGISIYHLMAWNNEISESQGLEDGLPLVLYRLKLPSEKPKEPVFVPVAKVDILPGKPLNPIGNPNDNLPPNTFQRDDYLYYLVTANENVFDIASKFQVNVSEIMILNNFKSNQIAKKGIEVRIKKL